MGEVPLPDKLSETSSRHLLRLLCPGRLGLWELAHAWAIKRGAWRNQIQTLHRQWGEGIWGFINIPGPKMTMGNFSHLEVKVMFWGPCKAPFDQPPYAHT